MKKGLSAIVATVLIILVTVAGVVIMWVAVIPLIQNSFAFQELDGRVTILGTSGWTVYDAVREIATVQVKREVDDGAMDRIKISFSVDGNSVSSTVIAPDSGQMKVYAFDLSGYGKPDSVGAAPIFVSSSGKEKEGSVTSTAKMVAGEISEVRGSVYEMERDYFYEVPTDGLVSFWTFSGDAKDGWGGNDGTVYGEGDELVDGVLSLDGVGDYVNCGDNNIDLHNGGTVLAWAKLADKSADHAVFGISQEVQVWFDEYGVADRYGMGVWDGGGSAWRTTYGSINPDINEWYHVIVIYSGNFSSRLFVNGVQEGVLSYPIIESNNAFQMGTIVGTKFFNGEIDNVMVYDRELSSGEIREIYEVQKSG